MKILIMCEGPNELKIVNLLLDKGKFKFTRDDLLDMRPFHARQLTSPQLKPALDAYHGEIAIYRIGDKMTDSLNKVSEFEKVKAKKKPKDFCKQNVVYNRKKYDNSTAFYEEYFQDRIDLLTSAITEYHRTHGKHKSDEGYLFDLLK